MGTHLLRRLLREGHSVRALVHRPQAGSPGTGSPQTGSPALQKLAQEQPGKLELMPGDVVSGAGVEEAIAGCEAAIHLVGIILETGHASFERVHVLATENVVRSAKRAGIGRYLQMSALGSRPDGASAYQRSKFRGEELVRGSGLQHVILRPSLIFGQGDGFVTQMVKIMKSAPLIRPVPGTGKYRFRPIYIDDVVECFAQALVNPAALNHVVSLVGGEELPLEDLLRRIADCIGVHKPAVKIPMPLMKSVALLAGLLPMRPPVTLDQLKMLAQGSTADPREMMEIFNFEPLKFTEGLRRYLCNTASN